MTSPVVGSGRDEVVGEIQYHRAMAGDGLRPRDVAVWLPPGYRRTGARHPVLYLYDGHNAFDPATSYAGVDWQLDEIVVALADAGRIEAPIMVAPHSDEYRVEEYGRGPTADAYLAWMIDDLKEMIDTTYHSIRGREATAVMGSSMGGLAAFRALWLRPDVFSMAGCLSPAFSVDILLAREVAASDWPPEAASLYIDNGGDDLDTRLQPAIDEMLAALRSCGFEERGRLEWIKDADGRHHETSWSRRVWRPLQLFFGPG